jgi:hypothetical protein
MKELGGVYQRTLSRHGLQSIGQRYQTARSYHDFIKSHHDNLKKQTKEKVPDKDLKVLTPRHLKSVKNIKFTRSRRKDQQ